MSNVLRLSGLLSICMLIFSCEPIVTTFDDDDELIKYYKASDITEDILPKNLDVATWNIKFGGGGLNFFWDCYEDPGRGLMTETEVHENLDRIVAVINDLDPDIIMIQEVDVGSKRSAYVDQIQYILNRTVLNYGVYSSLWKAQYIPSDGIGRMDMGNAILAKWELTDAERIAFELRTDQDALTQYFYLRRNIIRAKINVGTDIHILNTHLSAYSQDGSKLKQLKVFKEILDEINADGENFIAGGDLNTIPPNATQKDEFSDSICEDEDFQGDDYTEEVGWLIPLYADYTPAIDTLEYAADEESYFTHTVNSDAFQTRKVDYLFTNMSEGWSAGLSKVHNGTIMKSGRERVSDHSPVTAVMPLQ